MPYARLADAVLVGHLAFILFIVPVIYPPGLTHTIQVGLGVALLVFNAAVYTWVWWRHRST